MKAKKIHDSLMLIVDVVLHFLPVKKNWIMFTSFWGQYNDNPKYISEYLHSKYDTINIFWGISRQRSKEELPSYITVCKYNSLKYLWYKNRCRVVVDNIIGDYSMYGKNVACSYKRIVKNKKQFNLSTWHGNPIKKIGRDMFGGAFTGDNDFFTTSDLLICGCKYVHDIFASTFKGVPKIEILGTPRCDTMFYNDVDVCTIKKKLKIPSNKKVLLYAPTYRNNPQDSGINQLKSLDVELLLNTFSKKFGGEWILVFRVHNSVLKALSNNEIFEKGIAFNGNLGDDMMEYMQIADAMITDYSGAIFDYTHTYRPCFLYALDKDHYINEERGVYLDINCLPYTFTDSAPDLYDSILSFDYDKNKEKIDRFNNFIGNIEDGNASKRVSDLIIEYLNI